MTPNERQRRLRSIHGVASELPPVESPDLTDRILDHVDRVRPFMSDADRRVVTAGRVAIALGAVCICLALVVSHLALTRMGAFGTQPAPLTALLDSTGSGAETIRGSLAKVRSGDVFPTIELDLEPAPPVFAPKPYALVRATDAATVPVVAAASPELPATSRRPDVVRASYATLSTAPPGFVFAPVPDRPGMVMLVPAGTMDPLLAGVAQSEAPAADPEPPVGVDGLLGVPGHIFPDEGDALLPR